MIEFSVLVIVTVLGFMTGLSFYCFITVEEESFDIGRVETRYGAL